jgi:hypothetical protein
MKESTLSKITASVAAIIVHVGLPITRHAVSLRASGSGEAQAHPGGFFLASAQRTAIKSDRLDSMK